MKAVVWHGKRDVRVEKVPDPEIVNPRDAIVRVSSTAICGSDLHLYTGAVPRLAAGDILGHEFMGEIVDKGPEVKKLELGDRVVVSCVIACGACWFCQRGDFAACDNSNPNSVLADKVFGHSSAGLFGYSHMFGGYSGGQAEYVRVPFADVGCLKVPSNLDDDRVLFLSDILPTAWMAAENALITRGDVVAVFGAGPVGQLAVKCAFLMGARRVFVIDRIEERLQLAMTRAGAEPIDERTSDVLEVLDDLTGGRGPDACIDAVGIDGRGSLAAETYGRMKHAIGTEENGSALRASILACRKGGTVSVVGISTGKVDKLPLDVAFSKGLTLKMGQAHCQRYMRRLLDLVSGDSFDPAFIITHRLGLEDAAHGYDLFYRKLEGCVKVVMRTGR